MLIGEFIVDISVSFIFLAASDQEKGKYHTTKVFPITGATVEKKKNLYLQHYINTTNSTQDCCNSEWFSNSESWRVLRGLV